MKFIVLVLCLVVVTYASIDDKTTPNAYYIAQAFNEATTKGSNEVKCPFPKKTKCDKKLAYRSLEGTCNNLKNPLWGSIETPFKRILGPAYDDGFSAPRIKSSSGNNLPSPRVVSTTLHSDNSVFERIWTHAWVIFGQFLTHDIASTAKTNNGKNQNFQGVDCPCNSLSQSCLNVKIPPNDTGINQPCIQITRSSASFPTVDCDLSNKKYREQLNLMSSFLDGTQIYGINETRSKWLRTGSKGLLRTSPGVASRDYLPLTFANGLLSDQCSATNPSIKCFVAGETRTSENVGLSGMHTLFMREHNRIATQLANVNPNWSDDKLFNEARKILLGVYQHIIYSQYIPSTIGNNPDYPALAPLPLNNYFTGYDPNVNPSLFNEFSTATLRFGHSTVLNIFNRYNPDNSIINGASINISSMIFNNDQAYNVSMKGIESIFLGLLNEVSSRTDMSIGNELQNKLPADPFTLMDLAATNINRGRDHGIQAYTKYREFCGLPPISTFDELVNTVRSTDNTTINRLKSAYENVADIDLWVGGLSESNRLNGGVLGQTFSCLFALQFLDLKRGDRFFYENAPNATLGTSKTAFAMNQLNEIKKQSLSSVICRNYDLVSIQPNIFFTTTVVNNTLAPNNDKIPCASYPDIDFSLWIADKNKKDSIEQDKNISSED